MKCHTYLHNESGRMFTIRENGIALMSDENNQYSDQIKSEDVPPLTTMIYCGFYILTGGNQ